MKKLLLILISIAFLISPVLVFAHPGNTDAYGCHTCRTNCSKWGLSQGEYHCHKSKGLIQPTEPIKSHKSNTGTGYTTPAPEYKIPTKSVEKVEIKTETQPQIQKSFWRRFLGIFGK